VKVDWKIVASTFGLIFLAELGDKTQLAAMAAAAKTGAPLSVFVGATTALAAVTLIGVALGEGLACYLPPTLIQKLAGAMFVIIGLILLVK